MQPADYGRILDYGTVTAGLRSLNADLHFDMGECLPGSYVLTEVPAWVKAQRKKYAGVFYRGRLVASMDRGEIPEYKIWTIETRTVEIPPEEVSQHELAWTQWNEIEPGCPEYDTGIEKALTFSDGYAMETSRAGQPMLKKYRGYTMARARGPIQKLGWRHTFERLLLENIPNVNRRTIGETFGVDMLKFPVGAPEELRAALIEE